jgi:hypothetical protein
MTPDGSGVETGLLDACTAATEPVTTSMNYPNRWTAEDQRNVRRLDIASCTCSRCRRGEFDHSYRHAYSFTTRTRRAGEAMPESDFDDYRNGTL